MYDKLLDTFLAVADTGSFAKAAEKQFISTTAVMKQMNTLEAQLGLSLLTRSNQGITLTKAGKSVYEDAKKIIKLSNDALKRASKAALEEDYTIRVGTSFLNPCKVIMDLWSQVNSIYPQFKIQVFPFEDDHTNILSVISSLGTDFDIIAGICSSKKWLARCNFLELSKHPFSICVPRNHPLAHKSILSFSDLKGCTLMMCAEGDCDAIDQMRRQIKKEYPDIQIEDTPTFYDMTVFNRCASTGNLLLSMPMWSDIHPGLVTLPLSCDYTNSFGILYSKSPSPDVIAFLNILMSSLKL